MGLLGGVFDDGAALRHDGGHHDVHGGAHGDHIQIDAGALQPLLPGGGPDEAALHRHVGPQGVEALDMLVDGPDAAEVAAPRQGYLRLAEAAQQSADKVGGGPDAPGQVIGGAGGVNMAAVHLHGVAVQAADPRAQLLQNAEAQRHVGNLGDVFNAADPVHQQRGGDDGHGGVFRAADLDFAKQGCSALYNIFCQWIDPLFKQQFAGPGHLREAQETVCPAGGASYPRGARGGKFFLAFFYTL